MNNWINCVGSTIKEYRLKRNLTQQEVAEMLSNGLGVHVSQGYVCKVEKNICSVSLERLFEFCKILSIFPSQLFKTIEKAIVDQQLRESLSLANRKEFLEQIMTDTESGPDLPCSAGLKTINKFLQPEILDSEEAREVEEILADPTAFSKINPEILPDWTD